MTGEIASRQKVRRLPVELSAPSAIRNLPSLSRFAIHQTTTHRWSFLDDVTAYSEFDFGGVGIWRSKLVEFGEERGIELIRDSGLSVSSLSWAGGFTGWNGHSFLDAVDDARTALQTAGELNADCLVVISGARCGHTFGHARELLVDALKLLADEAAEHGLSLAVQPMHSLYSREWSFLTSLDHALDVLDECNHPHVKLAFDVYHLWQQPRLLDRIPEIAERTAIVQLNDRQGPPQVEFDQLLPGDGEIPFEEITTAFHSAGYNGFFEIKVWSEELWNSDYHELLDTCRSRFGALCPW